MITKNNQTQPLTEQKLHISSSSSSSLAAALEAVAHRQDDDEDERDDDAQDDELDLHVLQPHLSPHLGALLPEILCLQAACLGSHKKQVQVCNRTTNIFKQAVSATYASRSGNLVILESY